GCPADDLHRGGHAQIVLRLLAHVEGPYIAVQVIRGGAHQNGAARVQTDKKILGGRVPETLLYGYPYVVVPPLPGRIGQGQSWGQKAIEELVLVIAYRSGELEPIIQKFLLQLQIGPIFVIGDRAIDVRKDGSIGIQY